MNKKETLTIQGAMGKLCAIIQKPEIAAGEKCPLVMILHGFSGNKNEPHLSHMADELEKAGIASIRFDFNGHGESEGAFENMTVLNEIEDARCVYNYVRQLDFVSTVSLAGHSQGGVVSSMLAGQLGTDNVQCVVLMAPAAVLRDDAIRGNTMGVMYDPLNPPEYVEIFNGLKLGRDYIRTAFDLPIYETAEKYTGKVCLIHGTGDRVVPYTFSEHYNRVYKNAEMHIIPAEDHGFSHDMPGAVALGVQFIKANVL